MNISNKRLGRIIALLFLLLAVTGSTSLNLRGLTTSMFDSPTFFSEIASNAFSMRLSVVFDLIASVLLITIAVLMYPMMREHNRGMSIWFLITYITYFVIIFISDIYRLALINFSIDLSSQENPGDWSSFALTLWDGYVQAHFFTLILSSIGAAIFYYFIAVKRLIPLWLGIWGIAAVATVFTVTWMQIFDISVDFAFYTQNGVFILALIIWLFIKGFKEQESTSTP